jgi:hypothetical protein
MVEKKLASGTVPTTQTEDAEYEYANVKGKTTRRFDGLTTADWRFIKHVLQGKTLIDAASLQLRTSTERKAGWKLLKLLRNRRIRMRLAAELVRARRQDILSEVVGIVASTTVVGDLDRPSTALQAMKAFGARSTDSETVEPSETTGETSGKGSPAPAGMDPSGKEGCGLQGLTHCVMTDPSAADGQVEDSAKPPCNQRESAISQPPVVKRSVVVRRIPKA